MGLAWRAPARRRAAQQRKKARGIQARDSGACCPWRTPSPTRASERAAAGCSSRPAPQTASRRCSAMRARARPARRRTCTSLPSPLQKLACLPPHVRPRPVYNTLRVRCQVLSNAPLQPPPECLGSGRAWGRMRRTVAVAAAREGSRRGGREGGWRWGAVPDHVAAAAALIPGPSRCWRTQGGGLSTPREVANQEGGRERRGPCPPSQIARRHYAFAVRALLISRRQCAAC